MDYVLYYFPRCFLHAQMTYWRKGGYKKVFVLFLNWSVFSFKTNKGKLYLQSVCSLKKSNSSAAAIFCSFGWLLFIFHV